MKIAIFGGSFDPMHYGHVDIVRNLLGKYDKVIVTPTNVSYYKKNTAMFTFNQRIEMCKLMLEKEFGEKIIVSDIEKDIREDEGFSHILLKLKKLFPNDELYTVIGSDSYNYIYKWRNYQDIITNSKLVVITRPGYEISNKLNIPYDKIELSNDISSTKIRNKIIELIITSKINKID